ncbi:MAG: CDGSH iron-sulfur domain-containing protein [Flavobacteriaceae bacterium]|jgi:CDGSH-type Zn-finger protein|tara:strand:+ start:784 stop:969 length:186 start_codon:yes stop_codon:yes gene_type:complete
MKQNTAPTIQVTASGKVVVTNAKDIVLLDSEGNPIAKRNRFTLCNCGKTLDRPFCDGAHKE